MLQFLSSLQIRGFLQLQKHPQEWNPSLYTKLSYNSHAVFTHRPKEFICVLLSVHLQWGQNLWLKVRHGALHHGIRRIMMLWIWGLASPDSYSALYASQLHADNGDSGMANCGTMATSGAASSQHCQVCQRDAHPLLAITAVCMHFQESKKQTPL